MTYQIQFRRDTAASWTAANPYLAAGETGFETDTNKFKIGDGTTRWAALAYGSSQVGAVVYQGTWNGTYSNNQKFEISVTQVGGFRAQVKYQSGSTVQYQSVLIKDSSFRFGDTKFTLTAQGTATVGNVVTDPASGNTSLVEGTATQAT